jgi:soluble lytic murein transglycosylase-like protein
MAFPSFLSLVEALRRPRVFAALLMSLAVVTGLWLQGRQARPVPAPHRAAQAAVHRPRLAMRPKPAAPPPLPPSDFDREQAMDARQLMERWTPYIREASRRFGVSGQWIRAVMMIESGGRTMLAPDRKITSIAGAMGLMQLMPKTWAEMRAQHGLGRDPYDPHDNVLAGSAYLAALYRTYGYPTMFAAYNDGPGMLAAHAAMNERLPAETENYVRDIASILGTGVRYRAGSRRAQAALTRPDGAPVMIDAGAVVSVRAALPGEYAPGVQSVVAVGRIRQGVKETVARATAIIRSHGGLI